MPRDDSDSQSESRAEEIESTNAKVRFDSLASPLTSGDPLALLFGEQVTLSSAFFGRSPANALHRLIV